jgi:bacterial/archaeal transporter family-2 protein
MKNMTWIIMALMAGAFLPLQAGLNARMGKVAGNPVYGSFISFVVGSIALLIYILATRQQGSWVGLKSASPVDWTGGIMGAFYVTVIILAFPRIGPALTFGLVVAGQMIISVLLDHTNILVAQQHSFNVYRLAGILLIIGGVLMIRKF